MAGALIAIDLVVGFDIRQPDGDAGAAHEIVLQDRDRAVGDDAVGGAVQQQGGAGFLRVADLSVRREDGARESHHAGVVEPPGQFPRLRQIVADLPFGLQDRNGARRGAAEDDALGSNPIGVGFSPTAVEELLSVVEQREGILVVDEAFIHYCPENSVTGLLADHPGLLITGSMTKILGIPGVRLGYMAGGERLASVAAGLDPWNLNCFAESVLLDLPGHTEDIAGEYERNVRRRESFRAGLEALGVYVYPSSANFFLCDFGRTVRPIEDKLQEHRILVRRCMNFPGVDDGRHLRLAIKDERSNEIFLQKLEEAMQCAENH